MTVEVGDKSSSSNGGGRQVSVQAQIDMVEVDDEHSGLNGDNGGGR